ncbi:MAG: UvrD-helicase domain-containing protein [Dysgonomonas sp.]
MPNQESSDRKNLIVYRASAGSGKTHRLTEEFLRLLFSSPVAYRHILAVTFTNKATDEMKSRIIEELFKLAGNQKSDYIKILSDNKTDSEEKVREKARKTLISILHDYSAFSVSTIDRFFQQTIRAFMREIGIGGGYSVELEQNKVLQEAIDSMLYGLERTENKQLLEWLIRFSEEKIENGETWNIRNDIQTLSGEIFKETYKAFSDQIQEDIGDKELFAGYQKELIGIIKSYESKLQQLGEKGLEIMSRYNLTFDDFQKKSRSPLTIFEKWAQGDMKMPNDSFFEMADNFEVWAHKDADAATTENIRIAYDAEFNQCIREATRHCSDVYIYNTACEINRYYFTLGILGDVDKNIREYTAENNIMLISDTTELLHKIINGTDSPFIYEKVGTYVDNYMIDEFQDTSAMQWSNFNPLIKDSLASGNKNLIVGDIKQSIYRWRNSDWKLLEEQIDIDFGSRNVEHKTLDTNWRSSENIVNFNNAVFKSAPLLLQEEFNRSVSDQKPTDDTLLSKIEAAYKTSYQQIAPNKKGDEGHVRVEFIDKKEQPNWQQYVLDRLPKTIEELQDKGYSLKDIAILVRKKDEGILIADTLLKYKTLNPGSKYKYDIISDEALLVGNAKSVKLIVSILRYVQNPTDVKLQSLAIYEFYHTKEHLSSEQALEKYFSSGKAFPQEVDEFLKKIGELPLYEMTEALFSYFQEAIEKEENVYLQFFLDMVLDFTIKQSSDLDAFLQWWDEAGKTKTIFTPEGQDAIRIMTIHKSKGLGFEVVVIPFCNWDIDHKQINILWCQPKVEPFNKLHLVPVRYSQKLKDTIFAEEYYNEKLHTYIDNLNIQYVAFTRAKKELIVFAPKSGNDKISDIASLFFSSLQNQIKDDKNSYINLGEHLNGEENIFEIGKEYFPAKSDRTKKLKEIKIDSLPNISYDDRLKLKLNNKYYFSEKGQREYGTLLHEVLSKIESVNELDTVIEDYYSAGDITYDEKNEIRDTLYSFLNKESVSQWYTGEYKILNEVEILQPNGSFIRPDRVMIKDGKVIVIDYKFGEKEDNRYMRQVKYYADQIRKMGYKDVEGIICYVSLGKNVNI